MKKWILHIVLVLMSATSMADMQALSTDDMANTTGQSGAEISLDMQLNLDSNGDYTCDGGNQFCRIAIASNNRVNASGQKWAVVKGVRGRINVQQLYLEGATGIATEDKNGTPVIKNGLKLTFNPDKPIQIRNLGFAALSAEEDTPTQKAYLATQTYSGGGFDGGRETGFVGMEMNANLAIGGTVKIYSIDK